MTELLPCPFCGGEVTVIETHPGRGELYCSTCDVVMGGNEAKIPEELTAAWNTRAERTCHSDNEPERLYGDRYHVFRCSECHEKVDLSRNKRPNYCPSCGARVVGDE